MQGDAGKEILAVQQGLGSDAPKEAVGHDLVGHAMSDPVRRVEARIVDRYLIAILPVRNGLVVQSIRRCAIGAHLHARVGLKAVPQQAR